MSDCTTDFIGLQHLSNTSSEMKNLFRILTLKIITCEESMKPQELCNALFGLKHMNASSSEMRRLLSFFSEQISKMENSFTGQGLATAICGLERMDTDVHEVRMVMRYYFIDFFTPHTFIVSVYVYFTSYPTL